MYFPVLINSRRLLKKTFAGASYGCTAVPVAALQLYEFNIAYSYSVAVDAFRSSKATLLNSVRVGTVEQQVQL